MGYMLKIVFGFVITLLAVAPASSHAYVTTSQKAYQLNEDAGLYLITYSFGHEDFGYQMPIIASRGETVSATDLEYSFLRNGTLRTSVGESVGIVLSKAKLEDGMYVVPKNELREFTLMVLFKLPKDDSSMPSNFNLKVDDLPFGIVRDGEVSPNHLNPGELNDYQTPEAKLIYTSK